MRLPAAIRDYVAAFDLAAVVAYRDGRLGATRDPPPDAVAWWCAATQASELVKAARGRRGDVPGAAAESGIEITAHALVLARAKAALTRIDAQLRRTGGLRDFNTLYREQRMAAEARGAPFMAYGLAHRRLRLALIRAAATGAPLALGAVLTAEEPARERRSLPFPAGAAKSLPARQSRQAQWLCARR